MCKSIKCPNCGSRLCDTSSQVFVHTKITRCNSEKINADYYLKCWKCKTTIGITKD